MRRALCATGILFFLLVAAFPSVVFGQESVGNRAAVAADDGVAPLRFVNDVSPDQFPTPDSPVQAAPAALPSEAAPLPKPEEKKEEKKEEKEGEKSDDAEKKDEGADAATKCWNFHAQTTAVAQGDPAFPAKYSGPNSLNSAGERQETLSADLFVGRRLWSGAEMHADALMWQGFGLSNTFGIEAFPNGDAYKAGTKIPDFMVARLFIRQTFGLGGEQEDVNDDQLTLAGKQDISRLTITVGRFTPTDIFDNNTYAHDAHTQFLNWAACTNLTWDYPSDSRRLHHGNFRGTEPAATGPCAMDSSRCPA